MLCYPKFVFLATLLVVGGIISPNVNAHEAKQSGAAIHTADDIQWSLVSNLLPHGLQMAVLEGDPTKKGPFTIRVKFPANYRNSPHTHTKAEFMTIISGTFNLGIGKKFDTTNTKVMPAGSFAVIQPGVAHYGWSAEETVLQIHGMGPRDKILVSPVGWDSNKAKIKKQHAIKAGTD